MRHHVEDKNVDLLVVVPRRKAFRQAFRTLPNKERRNVAVSKPAYKSYIGQGNRPTKKMMRIEDEDVERQKEKKKQLVEKFKQNAQKKGDRSK